jgi:subtilisin family serine protease
VDDDNDPSATDGSAHGTAMAGLVAAVANNSACSVGIAYEARIGMVRIMSKNNSPVTDVMRYYYSDDIIVDYE